MMRDDDLQRQMDLMQERIAWLELSLDESNKQVQELFERLDRAERQIRYLATMQDAQEAVRPLSEETPPPHY